MNDHPQYPSVPYNDTLTVDVVSADVYDLPFWNKRGEGSLAIFQEWLAGVIKKIPAEYMHTADIEISSAGGYEGSHNATITISYSRPLTKKEIDKRNANTKSAAARDLARARAQYEYLKAMFTEDKK